jgi:hypothetical protein
MRKRAAAYANRYLRDLRQSPKPTLGTPARSAYKPAGGVATPEFQLDKNIFCRYTDNMNFGDKKLMSCDILVRRIKSLQHSATLVNLAFSQLKNLQFSGPPPPPRERGMRCYKI